MKITKSTLLCLSTSLLILGSCSQDDQNMISTESSALQQSSARTSNQAFTLNTIDQYNAFISEGYTSVRKLEITGISELTDLSGLESIESITRLVITKNKNLVNLNGLSNLKIIQKQLSIGNNPSLISLHGLENLNSLSTSADVFSIIQYNNALTDISALNNIENVNANTHIKFIEGHNAKLIDFCSFEPGAWYNSETDSPPIIITRMTNGVGTTYTLDQIKEDECSNSCAENIYQGDIIISTRAEFDDFVLNGYTEVTGLLQIGEGFHSLTSIEGLTTLEGLECLTTVGRLHIYGNTSLENLKGLENLTKITAYDVAKGYGIQIVSNPNLTTLNALEDLSLVAGRFYIDNNDSLSDLPAFKNLNSIGDFLYILRNDGLTDISGFINVESIASYLYITQNHKLTDISGFNNLEKIEHSLIITGNPLLIDVNGFKNLKTVAGNLSIRTNAIQEDISGFNNLESIGNTLQLRQLYSLEKISGFSNLQSLGDFYIDDYQYADSFNSDDINPNLLNVIFERYGITEINFPH